MTHYTRMYSTTHKFQSHQSTRTVHTSDLIYMIKRHSMIFTEEDYFNDQISQKYKKIYSDLEI